MLIRDREKGWVEGDMEVGKEGDYYTYRYLSRYCSVYLFNKQIDIVS